MRVLVTGASGFTGQAVCAALLKQPQYEVYGLSQRDSSAHDWPMYAVDLRDNDAVQFAFSQIKPKAVIHLAARSFVDDADFIGFYDHNVVATTRLLDAARDHGVQRVIVASSANVYGVPASAKALTESDPLVPVNHYGASKLAAEHIARTYSDDFALTITRPFNYTGVGQGAHFLVPKLVAHFAHHKEVIDLGNLDVARDYTGLDDVVDAYVRLLSCDAAAGQTVNICSNNSYELRALLDLLTQISGHHIEVRSQPHFVRRHDIAVLRGDYSTLQTLTGWQPQQSMTHLLTTMLTAATR